MNKLLICLSTVLLSLVAWSAHAEGNALWRAEQSCLKIPTPAARAECEQQAKSDRAAFDKEMKQKSDAKALEEAGTAQPKKDGLCFKRQSTGETVCPN